MKLGIIIDHRKPDLDLEFKKAAGMGIETCQFVSWIPGRWTVAEAELIRNCSEKYHVKISAFWCGWSGPRVWNLYEGQETLGLVPPAFRFKRMQELMSGSDFAKELGVTDLITHVGFLPENPYDTNYSGVLAVLKEIAKHCGKNGQRFLFESGQETPTTLLRAIQDIGTDNVGVNLDAANLILYGKANPVDAVDTIGKYIWNVHAKDGLYPIDGRSLGKEVPIGSGKVDFALLLQKLKEAGYDGPITIEREIPDDNEDQGLLDAQKYLNQILKGLE